MIRKQFKHFSCYSMSNLLFTFKNLCDEIRNSEITPFQGYIRIFSEHFGRNSLRNNFRNSPKIPFKKPSKHFLSHRSVHVFLGNPPKIHCLKYSTDCYGSSCNEFFKKVSIASRRNSSREFIIFLN